MKRFLSLSIIFLVICQAQARMVVVGTQEEFNKLDRNLHDLITGGEKDIIVQFLPGTYFFQENHIMLEGIDAPELSISFQGKDARIVGSGPDFETIKVSGGYSCPFSGSFDPSLGFVDLSDGSNLDFRSEVRKAKGRPEVVDKEKGLYRILTDEPPLRISKEDGAWIILTQWYKGILYRVVKIEKGYIYFQCEHPVNQSSAYHDLDADYHYGKQFPRYILYNPRMTLRDKRMVHECDASRFMIISGCHFRKVSFSDLNFFGNGGGNSLFYLYRSTADGFQFTNCIFDSICSDLVAVYFTKGLSFTGNELRHLYRNGVIVGFESDRAVIARNRFLDTGLMLDNFACVLNQASETRITDNLFVDFSYCAIMSGIHYTEIMSTNCSALIEGNEMYQTEAFRCPVSRTLMDSGAIYITTISQGQVIRYNYVHDIDGARDNRGIFLDDGAIGLEVYGNLVLGIANSYCIDARRVRWVETHPRTRVTKVNINNYIGRNTVDGSIRFETRGGRDGCRKRPNTVLKTGYDRALEVDKWRKKQ